MKAKQWSVVLVAALWVIACVTAVRGDGQADEQAGTRESDKPEAKKKVPPREGSPLLDALGSLKLDDQTHTRAFEALAVVVEKNRKLRSEYFRQRRELKRAIDAEADKDKKAELERQLDSLAPPPSPLQAHQDHLAALKAIVTAAQLEEFDAAVKAAQTEHARNIFQGNVTRWSKRGIELTDLQKVKLGEIRAAMDKDLQALAPGDRYGAMRVAMKSVWKARKAVLTKEQNRQAYPPRTPRPQSQPDTGEGPEE
jgi:hypothetical protein